MEHQRKNDDLEQEVSAREFHLCECVRGKGCNDQVTEGTARGDKHGVKDVTGERNPRVVHQGEQVSEVTERRAHNIEARGEHPELVKRLQGLHDNIQHRQEHKGTEDHQEEGDTRVTACGTVEDNFMMACS